MESRPILICLLLALAAIAAGCSSAPPDGSPFVPTTGAPSVNADPSVVLSTLVADVNATLEEVDRNVASAAGELGATGLAGPGANATLARLAASSPYAADAVTITSDGRIAAAMPEEFGAAVGANVGNQSHVQRGLAERRPLMSEVFRAVEGFDAVAVQRPVTGGDGTFLGLVSAVVEPDLLLADRSDRATSGTTLVAWAMAPDGRVIYDRDPARIGRNVITDPAYSGFPEFVAMAKRIGAEPAGSGSVHAHPARRRGREADRGLGNGRAPRDAVADRRGPRGLNTPAAIGRARSQTGRESARTPAQRTGIPSWPERSLLPSEEHADPAEASSNAGEGAALCAAGGGSASPRPVLDGRRNGWKPAPQLPSPTGTTGASSTDRLSRDSGRGLAPPPPLGASRLAHPPVGMPPPDLRSLPSAVPLGGGAV